jgi:hypothetical protein
MAMIRVVTAQFDRLASSFQVVLKFASLIGQSKCSRVPFLPARDQCLNCDGITYHDPFSPAREFLTQIARYHSCMLSCQNMPICASALWHLLRKRFESKF